MIIFVNSRNEIKDVDVTKDKTLTPYEITENDINPFTNWSVAKICCYKVALTTETVTEVVGYEDVTYTNLEGNEITETRAITETKETGKYFVSMYTPYVNSLIIEHLDRLGEQNLQTEETVTNLEIAVCENYESSEEYKESTNSQIDNLQLAVVEVYEMLLGGI